MWYNIYSKIGAFVDHNKGIKTYIVVEIAFTVDWVIGAGLVLEFVRHVMKHIVAFNDLSVRVKDRNEGRFKVPIGYFSPIYTFEELMIFDFFDPSATAT